jgi:hypothetical protein
VTDLKSTTEVMRTNTGLHPDRASWPRDHVCRSTMALGGGVTRVWRCRHRRQLRILRTRLGRIRKCDCRSRTPCFLSRRLNPLIAAWSSFASVGKVIFFGPHGAIDRDPLEIVRPQRAGLVCNPQAHVSEAQHCVIVIGIDVGKNSLHVVGLNERIRDMRSSTPPNGSPAARSTRAASSSRAQKRGVFGGIRRELRRRSAIEAVIGHLKTDGRLGRISTGMVMPPTSSSLRSATISAASSLG